MVRSLHLSREVRLRIKNQGERVRETGRERGRASQMKLEGYGDMRKGGVPKMYRHAVFAL